MNRPADHSFLELEHRHARHSHRIWTHRPVYITLYVQHKIRFVPDFTRLWYRWLHYCAMNWAAMPELRAASMRLNGTLLTWRNILPPE